MSMQTPAEWVQHASCNMDQAYESQLRATRQNVRSKMSHGDTATHNVQMYRELAQAMKHKVGNSHRLIEMLQKRADSVERSMQQTQVSLASLEKALKEKDAPLQLCKWRAEQREKRPLREQVRDPVETALEEEKAAILDTQRKLREAIVRTKVMINELANSLRECQHDLEHKMQALSVDEMCLRSTEHSMCKAVERTPPPSASGPRSPNSLKARRHQVQLAESSRNEADRHRVAEYAAHGFAEREQVARVLREDNGRLERLCASRAAEARAKSERRTQERVQDGQTVRRRLEDEMRETQRKIHETKHTMTQTKYQIKALGEPIDNSACCSSFRQQRAEREGIVDPVSTALMGHRTTILDCQQELVGHHLQEKMNLQDLQLRRAQLKEDLRDKTSGIHIDLNCLTHDVVQLNGSAWTGLNRKMVGRLSKVDRSWVPGTVAVSRRSRRPQSARG